MNKNKKPGIIYDTSGSMPMPDKKYGSKTQLDFDRKTMTRLHPGKAGRRP